MRYEIDPVPSANLKRHLENMPQAHRRIMKDHVRSLSESDMKNVGEVTALEILWAIGRLFEREDFGG